MKCKLCDKTKEIQDSHIIPRFVFQWQKKTSTTGFLRSSTMINKRIQDGIKLRMLCIDCEKRFNEWETIVANTIFHPLNKQQAKIFRYESWLLKFATSVSWRALTWYMTHDPLHYSSSARQLINEALITWKEFILEQRFHPSSFEQHMILFDAIESIKTTRELPPNMNRYLVRTIHINLAHTKGQPLFIYTKMGRMVLFGFIHMKYPRRWVGTKIHVKQGVIGGDITVPSQVLNYLADRAERVNVEYSRMSVNQKDSILRTIRKNLDMAAFSESFEMMQRDVEMFGEEAVFEKDGS